ncbi:uncharacterized protein DS421_2g56290 [Arachis hypogaea]|nr:uncharacterized protein DS421_2g56290 [Arachis hypogaea]
MDTCSTHIDSESETVREERCGETRDKEGRMHGEMQKHKGKRQKRDNTMMRGEVESAEFQVKDVANNGGKEIEEGRRRDSGLISKKERKKERRKEEDLKRRRRGLRH